MRLKFLIVTFLAAIVSYCNAAIYRVDTYQIQGSSVYCLHDWHTCADKSVNGAQRQSIARFAKNLENASGNGTAVVIAEDPEDYNLNDPIFAGMSPASKKLFYEKMSYYKGCAFSSCPALLAECCQKLGVQALNADFRGVKIMSHFGFLPAYDVLSVHQAVRKEVTCYFSAIRLCSWVNNTAYDKLLQKLNTAVTMKQLHEDNHFSGDEYIQYDSHLIDARFLMMIRQNLDKKKHIIVVAGGDHIEGITANLQLLATESRVLGITHDSKLITEKIAQIGGTVTALKRESVFDLDTFFAQELKNVKPILPAKSAAQQVLVPVAQPSANPAPWNFSVYDAPQRAQPSVSPAPTPGAENSRTVAINMPLQPSVHASALTVAANIHTPRASAVSTPSTAISRLPNIAPVSPKQTITASPVTPAVQDSAIVMAVQDQKTHHASDVSATEQQPENGRKNKFLEAIKYFVLKNKTTFALVSALCLSGYYVFFR